LARGGETFVLEGTWDPDRLVVIEFATVEAAPDTLDAVARSVVADGFIRERAVVFERLRRLGVHCLDVPAERIGMDLINRYLLIKQRELI
jgi:uncharacterized protein (DUF58 family)